MIRALACVLAACLAFPAAAQQPDTLAAPPERLAAPADTLAAEPLALPSDTLAGAPSPRRERRPIVPLGGPAPRPGVPPARAPFFGLPALLEAPRLAPHAAAFRYDLGVPGAPEGLSVGGAPPHRLAATLDGRPADDLFTGRPLLERLPEDVLAPVHLAVGRLGATEALAAETRAFDAAVALTEIRYRAGPEGLLRISATHAQTRRPGFAERLGGEGARVRALLHVASTEADGFHTNARVGGWQAAARVGLAAPGFSLEVTERHQRRTEGAWGGVAPEAANPFQATAPVVSPVAERFAVQNDLAATLRVPLLAAEPLALTGAWTALRFRYRDDAGGATEARGDRFALHAVQPLAAGPHRLAARLDAWLGRSREGNAFAAATVLPPELHATLTDSLDVAGFALVLAAGLHADGEGFFPSARLDALRPLGPVVLRAGVRHGAARLAPVERLGFGEHLEAEALARERTTVGALGAGYARGDLALDLDATLRHTARPRLLALDAFDAPARAVTADEPLVRALVAFRLGLRADAPRGLYAEAAATWQSVLDAEASPLHRREAEALPDVWGHARLGARARALFGGALDLDLFTRVRAWTAFQGRVLHAPTALFVLAPPEAPAAPARPALDVGLEAGFGQGRARFFMTYENALAESAFAGTYVVPVYPLAPPALRVGLFWVLPG